MGEHAPAPPGGNLVGIDLGVFGLAAMESLQDEGRPQDAGQALVRPEVGQPVPGKETLTGHDQAIPLGRHGLEQGGGSGLHMPMQQDFSVLADDADRHGAGMQVDPTVKLMLVGGASHEVSSFLSDQLFIPTASIPPGYAEGEASIIIKGMEPTAYSARSCLAPTSGGG